MKLMRDGDRTLLNNIIKAVAPEKGIEFTDLDILAVVNNMMYVTLSLLTLVWLHLIRHQLH
jgi:hypothetical protein